MNSELFIFAGQHNICMKSELHPVKSVTPTLPPAQETTSKDIIKDQRNILFFTKNVDGAIYNIIITNSALDSFDMN